MFCLQCGTQTPEGTQYCPNCGALVSATGTPLTPPQPEANPAPAPTYTPDSSSMPVTSYPPPQTPTQPEPMASSAPPQMPVQPEPMASSAPPQMPVQPDPIASYAPPHEGQQQQYNAEQAPFIPEPAPAAAPGKPRKKNKKPIIIAAAVVLVVLLGVGGFLGVNAFMENQRSTAYAEAVTLQENENYQTAYDKFVELGEYEDCKDRANYCLQALDYQAAEALYVAGDHAAARDAFAKLGTFMDAENYVVECEAWLTFKDVKALTDEGKFEEASTKAGTIGNTTAVSSSSDYQEWYKKNAYGAADQLFANGQYYTAYTRFKGLKDYNDAAARAQACVQATPGNTEFYHNEGFQSSATELCFDAGASTRSHYIKVYSGSTLVSSLFVNPGGSTTIHIPPGDYTFKDADGELWFGENDMFGMEGSYEIMLFDGSNESVHLDGNMIYTVTLYVVSGGTVGNRSVGPDGF